MALNCPNLNPGPLCTGCLQEAGYHSSDAYLDNERALKDLVVEAANAFYHSREADDCYSIDTAILVRRETEFNKACAALLAFRASAPEKT